MGFFIYCVGKLSFNSVAVLGGDIPVEGMVEVVADLDTSHIVDAQILVLG